MYGCGETINVVLQKMKKKKNLVLFFFLMDFKSFDINFEYFQGHL